MWAWGFLVCEVLWCGVLVVLVGGEPVVLVLVVLVVLVVFWEFVLDLLVAGVFVVEEL